MLVSLQLEVFDCCINGVTVQFIVQPDPFESEEVLLIINTGTVGIDRIVLDKWKPLHMFDTSQVVPPQQCKLFFNKIWICFVCFLLLILLQALFVPQKASSDCLDITSQNYFNIIKS